MNTDDKQVLTKHGNTAITSDDVSLRHARLASYRRIQPSSQRYTPVSRLQTSIACMPFTRAEYEPCQELVLSVLCDTSGFTIPAIPQKKKKTDIGYQVVPTWNRLKTETKPIPNTNRATCWRATGQTKWRLMRVGWGVGILSRHQNSN